MNEGITLVTGYKKQPDGSYTVELKGTGFEHEEHAVMLVAGIRRLLDSFSETFFGEVKVKKCNADSADEAIAVFQSQDATKQ